MQLLAPDDAASGRGDAGRLSASPASSPIRAWPILDASLLVEDSITLPVQVNGKKRADVTVARDADQASIEAAVLGLDGVQRALEGKPPRKIIVVPQRIVNVVA